MLRRGLLLLLACLAMAAVAGEERGVLLALVGDVMLARTVPARLAAHGPAWPWERLAPYLQPADLRFCNLECAVTTAALPIPKKYSFKADPAQTGVVLAAGGFNVVSLANNHTYDYGRTGLADTLANMERLRITAAGVGPGRTGAIAPRLVTCRGLKLAFVAYTQWTPEKYLPAEDGAALATLDEATLAAELRAAKQGADYLIVSLHWGREYAAAPSPAQQRLARLIIDAGADLVVGHHPHVAQPVEIYRDRPILYSLGNCLFDRSGAHYSTGLLAQIRLTPTTVTLEHLLKFAIEDARPGPVREEQTP